MNRDENGFCTYCGFGCGHDAKCTRPRTKLSWHHRDEIIMSVYSYVYQRAIKMATRMNSPDDLAQAGMVAVIEAFSNYNPSKSKPITYFGRVAVNAMMDYKSSNLLIRIPRTTRMKNEYSDDLLEIETLPDEICEYFYTENELETKEENEVLDKNVSKLAKRTQHIIKSRLDGETCKSIGERLHLTRQYVGVVYNDALAKLAKGFKREQSTAISS